MKKLLWGKLQLIAQKIVRMLDVRVTEPCGHTEIFQVGRDQYVSLASNSGGRTWRSFSSFGIAEIACA